MTQYLNKSGKSSVISFMYDSNSITVEFEKGAKYLYNEIKPGIGDVRKMIELANSGNGLGTYINKVVRTNYFKRLR